MAVQALPSAPRPPAVRRPLRRGPLLPEPSATLCLDDEADVEEANALLEPLRARISLPEDAL